MNFYVEEKYLDELSLFLPNSIKLEIIKKELIELYGLEKKYEGFDSLLIENINKGYEKIINYLKYFNLPDEIIVKLYIWAKEERQKMELSDNLYNVMKEIIPCCYRYDDLNEKVNSKQIFK